MRVEKLAILKKIVEEHNIKPTSSEFEQKVESVLREKIAEEINLHYVAPQTFENIANVAKYFKSDMKILWTSSKVCKHLIYHHTTIFYSGICII